jgi:hypothetical protein
MINKIKIILCLLFVPLQKIFLFFYSKNLIRDFSDFSPSGGGTINRAASIIANLKNLNYSLLKTLSLLGLDKPNDPSEISIADNANNNFLTYNKAFEMSKSDKANNKVFCNIFDSFFYNKAQTIQKVLEIGIGSKDKKVPSNHASGSPSGSSLRGLAFFFSTAVIHGVDIDEKIFFQEERIKCFKLNQLELASFESNENLFSKYDVIIDDGVHLVSANLLTLNFALDHLNENGFLIIEDIPPSSAWLAFILKILLNYKGYKVYVFDQGTPALGEGYCLVLKQKAIINN